MSPEAKQLKFAGIATMFAGFAAIIVGVVLIVQDFDMTDLCPLFAGALNTVLGAQGARAANVPSSAQKLFSFSLVVALICIAAGVSLYFVDTTKMNAALVATIVGIFACIVFISIYRVKKALERI